MSLRLGSVFGIPIFLHWTLVLVPLWVLYSQPTTPTDSDMSLTLVFTVLPLIFGCVLLHEFGHALTARYFGIGTADVTLYPIGGVARLNRMTEHPLEEFLIAVAGPAVNVVIAAILAVGLGIVAAIEWELIDTFAFKVAGIVCLSNVMLVLFNMLPAFPMDGGRVLRAFLAAWLGHFPGTQIAVAVGTGVAILMGLAGAFVTGNFMLVIIAAFVIFAGQQELLASRAREQQRRWDDEEPLEVLPVRPLPHGPSASAPVLMLQPKISVYTWDNQTGTWRKDPGAPA